MNDARKWGGLALAFAALAACGASTTPAGQQQDTGPQLPQIASFTASPPLVAAGGSSTLAWSVTGADTLELDQGIGAVTGSARQVSPSATTTYRLTARNVAGSSSATATVALASSAADVTVAVDSSAGRRPISPLVYGFNGDSASGSPPGTTWLRLGGNRWTAYNWETNHSNAGSDWYFSNDTYMGAPADGPAHAAVPALDDRKAHGLGVCVTIPLQGWVSKDASGNVSTTGPLTEHFLETRPRKGSAFASPPDATDAFVYQDELAAFLAARWGTGQAHPLGLMLDNEPDLWADTHAEIQRSPLTYASLLATSTASAKALKDAAPSALLFGPASYGWNGFVSLQDAPDAAGRDFLDHYLSQMKSASDADGRRLLDVLDLHFYSEAQGCGVRVTGAQTDACTVAARVQAPRSLWDPSYVETSWITQWSTGGAGVALAPRMQAKIDAHYPGTLLSISEYNHGGESHVSGAVAQADTLGILGEQGVYAASLWPLGGDPSWISAAWLAYRDYDGAGSHFGDIAVGATSSDLDHVAVHASDAGANRLVLVIVHRPTLTAAGDALDLRARTVALQVSHPVALGKARLWQLDGSSPVQGGVARPQRLPDAAPSGGGLTLTLPALSVTTVELTP